MNLKRVKVDGYKNLIDCTVELSNFNILVGPNNSGKSNFLEIFPMLLTIVFGREAAKMIEEYPLFRSDSYFCNLEGYRRKGITIEVVFDTEIQGETWRIEYSVSIERTRRYKKDEDHKLYFKGETLRGKPPSRRGAWKLFLKRKQSHLTVFDIKGSKRYNIGTTISSFELIRSIYSDFRGLGNDAKKAISGLFDIGSSSILALNPDLLRQFLNKESSIVPLVRNPFIGILLIVDNIYTNEKLRMLFESTLCDILDLDSIHFSAKDIYAEDKKRKDREFIERLRSFAIKKTGMPYSSLENYSDGTLVLIAILASLLWEKRRGSILCIEEPENYLHPRAVEKLLRFLQDHEDRWPVLITTHSPYLLNGVNPENVNVAVVNKKGAAHFEKVKNTKQLRRYLNKGLMSFGELLVKDFEGFREG